MQVTFIISSILGLVCTGLAAYFGIIEKKKSNIISIILIAIFGLIAFGAQQVKDYSDNKISQKKDSTYQATIDSIKLIQIKVKDTTNKLLATQNELLRNQINTLRGQKDLYGYATGGKDNKPLVTCSEQGAIVNRANVKIGHYISLCIYNNGNYPLSNVKLDIMDLYTPRFEIHASRGKYHLKDIDTTEKLSRNDYEKEKLYGTIESKHSSCSYKVFVLNGTEKVILNGLVHWNNQQYQFRYNLSYSEKEGIFYVRKIAYYLNGKEYKPSIFFPLLPKNSWDLPKASDIKD